MYRCTGQPKHFGLLLLQPFRPHPRTNSRCSPLSFYTQLFCTSLEDISNCSLRPDLQSQDGSSSVISSGHQHSSLAKFIDFILVAHATDTIGLMEPCASSSGCADSGSPSSRYPPRRRRSTAPIRLPLPTDPTPLAGPHSTGPRDLGLPPRQQPTTPVPMMSF